MKKTVKKKSSTTKNTVRKQSGSKKKRTAKDILLVILFIIYFAVLMYFLFFSERYGRNIRSSEYRYNLKPFNEIKRYIRYKDKLKTELFVVNIVGNILVFAPLGYFIPRLHEKLRSFIKVFFVCAFISLTIESLQLVIRCGSYDVDDMILNVFGSCLGYIFFALTSSKSRKKHTVRKGRKTGK
ncbi:MAG: VanZ family protein [Lachnospiraceae bacterium]|nr:VanZ family protein [Lachnospiraceae bacterium]